MGASAYGVDQMYLWYMDDGARFAADLVIVAIIGDDLRRATLTQWPSGHRRPLFQLVDDRLVLTNVPVPPRVPPGEPNLPPGGFFGYLAERWSRRPSGDPDSPVPLRILARFHAEVTASGREFLLVFLPSNSSLETHPRSQLAALADAEGMRYLDLRPQFMAAQGDGAEAPLSDRWLGRDGHYNPVANRVVAEGVSRYLHRAGLVAAAEVPRSVPTAAPDGPDPEPAASPAVAP